MFSRFNLCIRHPRLSLSVCPNNAACGASYFQRVVPGTRDPINSVGDEWLPYEVCNRCVDLGVLGAPKKSGYVPRLMRRYWGIKSFPRGFLKVWNRQSAFCRRYFEVGLVFRSAVTSGIGLTVTSPSTSRKGGPVCAVFTDQETLKHVRTAQFFTLYTR